MKRLGAGAILLTAALVLTGCGGDDDPAGGSNGGTAGDGAAAAGDDDGEVGGDGGVCELLPIDDVSRLFGRTAVVSPAEGAPADSPSCAWTAEDDLGPGGPTVWQLQLQVYEGGAAAFDPGVWGDDPRAIDDLADEAFVIDGDGLLGTTAGYRDGDTTVYLSYAIVLGAGPDSSEQADEVVELLRAVHDRL